MKVTKIVEKSDKELAQMITDSRVTIAQLAVDYRTKQMPNIKTLNATKKDLARALTVQREREISKEEETNE